MFSDVLRSDLFSELTDIKLNITIAIIHFHSSWKAASVPKDH